jgi:hypothetical protein
MRAVSPYAPARPSVRNTFGELVAQVTGCLADSIGMNEITFKEVADNIGYGLATKIAADAHDLKAFMARADAERKAQGRQSLAEEAEEAMDMLIEQLEAGELDNDAELVEIALLAKEERTARK